MNLKMFGENRPRSTKKYFFYLNNKKNLPREKIFSKIPKKTIQKNLCNKQLKGEKLE